MGSLVDEDQLAEAEESPVVHRSLSKLAITSLILLVIATPLVVGAVGADGFPLLTVLPIVGLVVAVIALTTIRRYPDEYSGKWLAIVAALAHGALIVACLPWHFYILAHEVPEGYDRITFAELQPDPQKGEMFLPERAFQLVGKQVFIKGYIHPAGTDSLGKVDKFILVPDMGTCCFGGQPPATHMVEVKIVGDAPKVRYSTRTIRLAGKFNLSLQQRQFGNLNNVFYHLEADHVKP